MRRTRQLDTEYEARVVPYSHNGNGHNTVVASYTVHDEVYKHVDILKSESYIALFLTARTYDRALSAAKKVGRVIFCRKVDPSYKLRRIEFLNLHQEPITIEVDRREIEVSPELEITPIVEERKIVVEVTQNGIDK